MHGAVRVVEGVEAVHVSELPDDAPNLHECELDSNYDLVKELEKTEQQRRQASLN